mgnify:CR=1 FL=1
MQGFRMVPAGSSQFYLLLTARDDQMTGKLYGPGAETGLPFTSLSRMVLQLEELMDTRGDAWEPWAPPEGFPKEAMELEILFRQNYSFTSKVSGSARFTKDWNCVTCSFNSATDCSSL